MGNLGANINRIKKHYQDIYKELIDNKKQYTLGESIQFSILMPYVLYDIELECLGRKCLFIDYNQNINIWDSNNLFFEVKDIFSYIDNAYEDTRVKYLDLFVINYTSYTSPDRRSSIVPTEFKNISWVYTPLSFNNNKKRDLIETLFLTLIRNSDSGILLALSKFKSGNCSEDIYEENFFSELNIIHGAHTHKYSIKSDTNPEANPLLHIHYEITPIKEVTSNTILGVYAIPNIKLVSELPLEGEEVKV